VEILYGDGDKYDRDRRYALADGATPRRLSGDVDATCFYALALLGTSHAGRDVPTYMKAGRPDGRGVREVSAASRARRITSSIPSTTPCTHRWGCARRARTRRSRPIRPMRST
jgi:hypothetical protein